MSDTEKPTQPENQAETKETAQRDALRAKIEANERRIAERTFADEAREGAQAAGEYAKQNPLVVVGGAVALGLLIGLMTRAGRKAAVNAATGAASAATGAASVATDAASSAVGGTAKTVGKAAKKQSAAVGTAVADSLVAYVARILEEALASAQASQDAVEDLSDTAAAKTRKAKREAGYALGTAADNARTVSKRTRRRATRSVRSVADRLTG